MVFFVLANSEPSLVAEFQPLVLGFAQLDALARQDPNSFFTSKNMDRNPT